MDERWTTVTLAADATKPHEQALRWVADHGGTGMERIRVVGPAGSAAAEALAGSARGTVPGVHVEVVEHGPGSSANAVAAASDDCDLLVVGSWRSRRGTTVGSGPARIAERAPVPTVVVPDVPHPIDGDVVLAVDEPLDERAVAIAVREAERRHRRLTVLRAWEMPVLTRTGLTDFAEDPMRWRGRNAELLGRVTAELRRRYPSLRIHPLLVEGHPGHAIAVHTRTASLVVLGQGHVHVLSGSVLHDVLREAVSPVCVVPPTAHADVEEREATA